MNKVSKSKWGFHPISREHYLKLKALHKLVWEQWRKAHALGRNLRKEPQNRQEDPVTHAQLVYLSPKYKAMRLLHFQNKGESSEMVMASYQCADTGRWVDFNMEASLVVADWWLLKRPHDTIQEASDQAEHRSLTDEMIDELCERWGVVTSPSLAPRHRSGADQPHPGPL